MEHWRVWAPILTRMAATGLALLGLAGIGWAAKGSGEFAALSTAPIAFGLAQMASSGVAALASPPPPEPAAAHPPTPCAPPSAAPERLPAPVTGSLAPGLTGDGRVILNRASAAELQRLPAVGAKRAAAILELRRRLGRFRRPSDLLRVRGIGPRTLERMLPLLVLDAS
jgi:competence protein ComEA